MGGAVGATIGGTGARVGGGTGDLEGLVVGAPKLSKSTAWKFPQYSTSSTISVIRCFPFAIAITLLGLVSEIRYFPIIAFAFGINATEAVSTANDVESFMDSYFVPHQSNEKSTSIRNYPQLSAEICHVKSSPLVVFSEWVVCMIGRRQTIPFFYFTLVRSCPVIRDMLPVSGHTTN